VDAEIELEVDRAEQQSRHAGGARDWQRVSTALVRSRSVAVRERDRQRRGAHARLRRLRRLSAARSPLRRVARTTQGPRRTTRFRRG
jgi:hypothetical protein